MQKLLTQKLALTLYSLPFLICLFLPTSAWSQSNGWNLNGNYRIPITVESLASTPQDKPVEVTINFTVALKAANVPGLFNSNSIQVVEVSPAGRVLDASVPFQFEHERDYHPAKKAQGKLLFWLKGRTKTARFFHLYFDSLAPATPTNIPPQPIRTEKQRYGKKGNQQDSPEEFADVVANELIISLGNIEINNNTATGRARRVTPDPIFRLVEVNVAIPAPGYKNKPEHKFYGGYCTWYAAMKWKEFTATPVTWSGDGGRWFDNAAEEGRLVSTDPRAAVKGAIIVWTRAGAAGHVAFVEDVDEKGVYISEMNAKGLWVVSDAYLPFTNLDKGTKYKFRGYILPE